MHHRENRRERDMKEGVEAEDITRRAWGVESPEIFLCSVDLSMADI
jgi:hypothetical protein